MEDTAIKLINDYKIIEYKRWQVFLKGILVFLCKKFPIGYQYIILKYFEKTDIKKISEFLKIDFKKLIILDNKLIELIYKKAEKRNMF